MKKVFTAIFGVLLAVSTANAATPFPEVSCSKYGNDALSCSQCFDGGTLYADPTGQKGWTNLSDDFFNNTNLTALIYQKENAAHDVWTPLQSGMKWITTSGGATSFANGYQTTTQGQNVYNIAAGQSMRRLQGASGKGFYLESVTSGDPTKPGYRYTFNTVYRSWDGKTLSDQKSHNECIFVYGAWCGDGKVTDGEQCDPKAPNTAPNSCDPVSCKPIPVTPSLTCDSISASPSKTSYNQNESITVTCNGTNATSWKLDLLQNGNPVKTLTQTSNVFTFNLPQSYGSFTPKCTALNPNANPKEATGTQCTLSPLVVPEPQPKYECKSVNVTTRPTTTNDPLEFTCLGGDGTKKINAYLDGVLLGTNTTNPSIFKKSNLGTAGNHTIRCEVIGNDDKAYDSTACQTTVSVTTPQVPLKCENIDVQTTTLPAQNNGATVVCKGSGTNINYSLRVTGPGFDKTYNQSQATNVTATQATFKTDILGAGTYSAQCIVSNGTTTLDKEPACRKDNSITVGENPVCKDLTLSTGTANPNENVNFTCTSTGDISSIKNYEIRISQAGSADKVYIGGAGAASFTQPVSFDKGGNYVAKCSVNRTDGSVSTSPACTDKNLTINGFDLSIKKYVNQVTTSGSAEDAQDGTAAYPIEIGQEFDYKIVVTNEGEATTYGETKVVDNSFPTNIQILSATASNQWKCDTTATSVQCTSSAQVAKGQTFDVITLRAKLLSANANGSVIRNIAHVENPNEKPGLDWPSRNPNNDDEANIIPKDNSFALKIKKFITYIGKDYDAQDADTPVNMNLNSDFDYKLVVSNLGNANTSGVITVTDNLPAEISFRGTSNDFEGTQGWNCAKTSDKGINCTRTDSLGKGDMSPIIIKVKVTSYNPGKVRNQACVSYTPKPGSTPVSNCDEANSTTPNQSYKLEIKKYIWNGVNEYDAQYGNPVVMNKDQQFDYRIRVKNNSTNPSSGQVIVTDTLPSQVTPKGTVDGQGDWNCTLDGRSLRCIATKIIPAGQTLKDIIVPVTYNSTNEKSENVACLAYPTDPTKPNDSNNPNDGNTSRGCDEATTNPNPNFVLDIKKYIIKNSNGQLIDKDAIIGKDEIFDYQIVVTNNGEANATGTITVSDEKYSTNVVFVGQPNGTDWRCDNVELNARKGFNCTYVGNTPWTKGQQKIITVKVKLVDNNTSYNVACIEYNPNPYNPNPYNPNPYNPNPSNPNGPKDKKCDDDNTTTNPPKDFELKIKKYINGADAETASASDTPTLSQNESFQYTIKVENLSDNPSAGRIYVRDELPRDGTTSRVIFDPTISAPVVGQNGWTCNATIATQSFECYKDASIAAKVNEVVATIYAKNVYAGSEATVNWAKLSYDTPKGRDTTNPNNSNPAYDNPKPVIVTPPTTPGGGNSYQCSKTPDYNGNNITCYTSAGYVNDITIDCGGGKEASNYQRNANGNYSTVRGTCSYPNDGQNYVREASCKLNGRTLSTPAPDSKECRIKYLGEDFSYPSCREIDPPSVKMGEVLPIWWQLSGANQEIRNAKCEVTLLRDETDLDNLDQSIREGKVKVYSNIDCDKNTLTNGDTWERNMLDDFFKSGNNDTFKDGYNEAMSNKGGSTFIDTKQYSNPGNRFGEYMVQLSKISYNKVLADGTIDTHTTVVDTKGTCQYNFALMTGYTIQVGSNIATSSPTLFDNFYRLRGNATKIFDSTFTSKLQSFVSTNYGGDNVNYLTNKFVENKTALAKTNVTSTDAGTTVRKTQGQEIYVFDGNAKFPNDISRNIGNKPTTFVVTKTATINGDMRGNIMLVAGEEIHIGSGDLDKSMKLEGIYITKKFSAEKIMNEAGNNTWANDGRLDVKGALIGSNLDQLSANRRPNIMTSEFFTNGLDLQKNLINAASLRISTNSAIWNMLPPGANEMNEIIQKSRR